MDLYTDGNGLQFAQDMYEKESSQPFAQALQALKLAVGTLNLQVEVVPVCTLPVRFEWNGQVVPSSVDILQRDAILTQFFEVVKGYCHD